MEAESVCAAIHYELIEAETDHADYGESEELSPCVLNPAFPENPGGAQQVIADQTEDKGNRRRPKIRQPRLLGEKPKAAIIDHERYPSDYRISEELPDKAIGLILQKGLK